MIALVVLVPEGIVYHAFEIEPFPIGCVRLLIARYLAIEIGDFPGFSQRYLDCEVTGRNGFVCRRNCFRWGISAPPSYPDLGDPSPPSPVPRVSESLLYDLACDSGELGLGSNGFRGRGAGVRARYHLMSP